MKKIFAAFQSFCADESGATAIEYGLLASLIALVAIVGMTVLGGANEAGWDAWVAQVLAVISPP